jgi:hypothetical protein
MIFKGVLATLALGCLVSCGGDGTGFDIQDDSGPDGGVSDADSDSDGDSDSDADTDSEQQPGEAGDSCWNDFFSITHPNAGLPDCSDDFQCIGNSEEAWCTTPCAITGEIHPADSPLDGWCCGELTSPCDPARFWLPESMQRRCIPRTAGLAGACENPEQWTGEEARCAPLCQGTELVHGTICAASSEGAFCTYPCDPLNEDADCVLQPEFADGCCGELLGSHFCLIAPLCP